MLKTLPIIKFNDVSKEKCGEIFCHRPKEFTIYCTLCDMKSFDFTDFLIHIENVHFNTDLLKLENPSMGYADLFGMNVKKENVFAEHEASMEEICCDNRSDILNGSSRVESGNEDSEEVLTVLKRTKGRSRVTSSKRKHNKAKANCNHPDADKNSKSANTTKGLKCHQCIHCSKTFVNCGLLKIHVARVHKNLAKDKESDASIKVINKEKPVDDQVFGHQKLLDESVIAENTNEKYNKDVENINSEERDDNQASDADYEPDLDNTVDNKKSFQCEDCDKTLSSCASLRVHIARYHETKSKKPKDSDNGMPCIECEEVFTNQKLYDRHCVEVHDGFKCSLCEKRFKIRYSCKRHELLHNKIKEFICSFEGCNKSFTEHYYLKRHQDVHQTERNFICNFENCGKAFHAKRRLWQHQKIHTKPKNFICDMCGYSCRERVTLRVHQRIHTGERPYVCKICNKTFISSSSLGDHMASHASTRTHVCKICNARFARPKALYHHSFLHLDVKKFKCRICGCAYKQAAGLAGHMRKHREEDIMMMMPLESRISLSADKKNLFTGFLS
uniref:C2H2-type domain-containing protein n=1 Tax=Glossina morsitans morsitans TaxID=37546 RepID=A0ABK9NH00_GLOMM